MKTNSNIILIKKMIYYNNRKFYDRNKFEVVIL